MDDLDHARLGHPAPDSDPAIEVRFIAHHDVYNAGERAHFPSSVATRLVDRGIAAYVAPPLDKMERGRAKK